MKRSLSDMERGTVAQGGCEQPGATQVPDVGTGHGPGDKWAHLSSGEQACFDLDPSDPESAPFDFESIPDSDYSEAASVRGSDDFGEESTMGVAHAHVVQPTGASSVQHSTQGDGDAAGGPPPDDSQSGSDYAATSSAESGSVSLSDDASLSEAGLEDSNDSNDDDDPPPPPSAGPSYHYRTFCSICGRKLRLAGRVDMEPWMLCNALHLDLGHHMSRSM